MENRSCLENCLPPFPSCKSPNPVYSIHPYHIDHVPSLCISIPTSLELSFYASKKDSIHHPGTPARHPNRNSYPTEMTDTSHVPRHVCTSPICQCCPITYLRKRLNPLKPSLGLYAHATPRHPRATPMHLPCHLRRSSPRPLAFGNAVLTRFPSALWARSKKNTDKIAI